MGKLQKASPLSFCTILRLNYLGYSPSRTTVVPNIDAAVKFYSEVMGCSNGAIQSENRK